MPHTPIGVGSLFIATTGQAEAARVWGLAAVIQAFSGLTEAAADGGVGEERGRSVLIVSET